MLARLEYNAGATTPAVPRTVEGSFSRAFPLPMELGGVTMSIGGVSVGLKHVSSTAIEFVVPTSLVADIAGTTYKFVINNNGNVYRGDIALVPARPDIFTNLPTPGPGGRVVAQNATNRILTTEPFTLTTFKFKGSRRVGSRIRVYLTGMENIDPNYVTLRIGGQELPGGVYIRSIVPVAPGRYYMELELNPLLTVSGDVPVVLWVTGGSYRYSTRLEDLAPVMSLL